MEVFVWRFLGAIVSVFTVTAQAQIVHDMTPERIREAITLGTSSKVSGPYWIQDKTTKWHFGTGTWAFYTTPFLRVSLAAAAASKQYKVFTEADVTPQMIAPEIQIYAPSFTGEGTVIVNAEAVILLPYGSKDKGLAVQPTQATEATEQYKNLFGFSGHGRGLLAVFPLDLWRESNEVHVVFDRYNHHGSCTDCKWRISLDKIR